MRAGWADWDFRSRHQHGIAFALLGGSNFLGCCWADLLTFKNKQVRCLIAAVGLVDEGAEAAQTAFVFEGGSPFVLVRIHVALHISFQVLADSQRIFDEYRLQMS